MYEDGESNVLIKIAETGAIEGTSWPSLRDDILCRLDKIALTGFPGPKLPSTPNLMPGSSPSSSMLAHKASPGPLDAADAEEEEEEEEEEKEEEEGEQKEAVILPPQIVDQLEGIKIQLGEFNTNAPHTIQRLAELVLKPMAHYRFLASFLHAVDRVVHVTSGTDVYPLPLPLVPDLSAGRDVNGEENLSAAAAAVSWGNSTTSAPVPALGSDEALGGALLTPVPWLTTTTTTTMTTTTMTTTDTAAAAASSSSSSSSSSSPTSSPPSTSNATTTTTTTGTKTASGARIHSEGTQTIDGPNGMGRIETVSVSVNGVPSTGHARGVTQGELLRQEQRAGVIPVSQLSRGGVVVSATTTHLDHVDDDDDNDHDVNDSIPHLRGPDHVGVSDTGPQSSTMTGEAAVQMHDIDVEAAVGRRMTAPGHDNSRLDDDDENDKDDSPSETMQTSVPPSPSTLDNETPSAGTKREADLVLETDAPKRTKETVEDVSDSVPSPATVADEKMEEEEET